MIDVLYTALDLPYVKLQLEESVHYGKGLSVEKEWLWNFPHDGGILRTYPDHHTFYLATYHALHCVKGLAVYPGSHGHAKHCLNMLRQSALCGADLTLERGDFAQQNFTTERTGAVKVCRDWEYLRDEATRNWLQWRRWQKENPPMQL